MFVGPGSRDQLPGSASRTGGVWPKDEAGFLIVLELHDISLFAEYNKVVMAFE